MTQQDVAGLPPRIQQDGSVADQIRSNLARAHARRTQDLLFPGSENLYIQFRAISDFAEFRDVMDTNQLMHLDEAQQEVQAAINTLVASSIGSYAVINGERVDLEYPLGLSLYNYIFPEQNGLGPSTDGEAVAAMFDGDTVALVMFARRLNVWRKIQAATVEANVGES